MSLEWKARSTIPALNLQIGADPEIFLKKKTGELVSAHGIVPGTKDNPYEVDGGAIQLDGTAVEFNILPAFTAKEFADNIKTVMDQIRRMIPEDLDFHVVPAVHYPKEYFDSIPEEHRELGCNPDFDAYNGGAPNPRPKDVGTMRTGSGHIHLGWYDEPVDPNDPNHLHDCLQLVQNLDAAFGQVEHLWDKDTDRRKMYGKPGCFRPKSYGLEYRSLSNAWVDKPDLHPFIFALAKKAFWVTVMGKSWEQYIKDESCRVRQYYGVNTTNLEKKIENKTDIKKYNQFHEVCSYVTATMTTPEGLIQNKYYYINDVRLPEKF